ncbi:MAG TPA: metallophosphoesterase, partial [Thermomicrobiales bacterium]|nr:metallophosphoesterase [Thermomicrobiales bacterium]
MRLAARRRQVAAPAGADASRSRGRSLRSAVTAAVLALAAAAAIVAYRARFIAPFRPVLERVSLPLPPGHERLAGLRIGFVTDVHVGPLMSTAHVERALHLLASARPDLVLFGGDFISDSPRYTERAAAVLGRFAAAAPLGAIAVLGNHDVANDAKRMTDALQRA